MHRYLSLFEAAHTVNTELEAVGFVVAVSAGCFADVASFPPLLLQRERSGPKEGKREGREEDNEISSARRGEFFTFPLFPRLCGKEQLRQRPRRGSGRDRKDVVVVSPLLPGPYL
jgi:hypothetical protein